MIIKNGSVFVSGQYYSYDIEITDGNITNIGPTLVGNDVIDATGKYVFPGMIETHIHGADLVSVNDGEDCVRRVSKKLPEYGITSYTPTPTANTIETSLKAVRGIRAAKGTEGADILGISFYSPYRNRSDAFYKDNVAPTKEHTLEMMDHDLSDVLMMCVAPELPGGMEWIKWAVSQGIIVMIGFTEATTQQIYEAASYGATLLDHFFNGFPKMSHHEEGSTIGCLLDDRLFCQMQFDHIHVVKPFIDLTIRVKGVEKVIATCDFSVYVGAPDGDYMHGVHRDIPVVKKDGSVRSKATGKLVTGSRSLDEVMRIGLAKGYTMEELGLMFTENAGTMLGLKDRGKIEIGRRGDIVIMDEGLNVDKTIILGNVVYE